MPKKVPAKPYERPDCRKAVEAALGRDLGWEDKLATLPEGGVDEYARAAQLVLGTEIWRNEKNRLIDLWVRSAVTQAGDYDQVRDMRMCVSALELFEERLRTISQWGNRAGPSNDDPHAPI